MTQDKDKAFFWLVSNAYLAEAERSAAQVARLMPHVPRWLFYHGTEKVPPSLWNEVQILSPRKADQWCDDWVRWMGEALLQLPEKSIHVDSDIYFAFEVNSVFDLLEKFDFVGAYAVVRKTGTVKEPVPDAFPEINTGFFGMYNNKSVRDLWKFVLQRRKVDPALNPHNEQPSLREALWHDFTGRLGILTPEYHCRYQHGFYAYEPVRVLHGRVGDVEKIAAMVNHRDGERVFSTEDIKGQLT